MGQDSLSQELNFLTTVFKQNGYSDRQIERAVKPARQTPEPEKKPTSTAYIPLYQQHIWTPQQNAKKIQHQECRLNTQENSKLSATDSVHLLTPSTLEDLFLLPLSFLFWVFLFFSSLPVLE